MNKLLYVATKDQNDGADPSVFVYERQSRDLVLLDSSAVDTGDPRATSTKAPVFSPDDKFLAVANSGSVHRDINVFRVSGSGALTYIDGADTSANSFHLAWAGSGLIVQAKQQGAGSDEAFILHGFDGSALTQKDTLKIGTEDGNFVLTTAAGKTVVGTNTSIAVYDVSSGVFVSEGTSVTPPSAFVARNVSAHPTKELVALRQSRSLWIYDVSSGTPAQIFEGLNILGSTQGGLDWGTQDRIFTSSEILAVDDSTNPASVTLLSTHAKILQIAIAVEEKSAHFSGLDNGEVWLMQTSDPSIAVDSVSSGAGSFTFLATSNNFPTITDEEAFTASYADASAADPKPTALIRPADVQRSIDTDVFNLASGPNLYTVEVIFDIGELENLNPYNPTTGKPRVFFVQDDQPGLRQGKNLLLKSYQIRSADPSVPVTCTFWG